MLSSTDRTAQLSRALLLAAFVIIWLWLGALTIMPSGKVDRGYNPTGHLWLDLLVYALPWASLAIGVACVTSKWPINLFLAGLVLFTLLSASMSWICWGPR